MRSGENALFSFSPNLVVDRNDPFTKLGIHRTQGDQIPTNGEQPHEETPLTRFYSCVAYVLHFSDELQAQPAFEAVHSQIYYITKHSRAYDANITKRI